tara:strand:+ start:315 stop:740 length:426 start_codon:yes stop_codon:yes gene_type:complete
MDGFKNLTSIKGVGDKGAAILLSIIGNINDFSNQNKIAAYFGIVARESNLSETSHHVQITKMGSKIGHTTLMQCALIAKRYNPYLNEFHSNIKRLCGKAIIALAKKFLHIIYRALKNNWDFEDFSTYKPMENNKPKSQIVT